MSHATIAAHEIKPLAHPRQRLGGIPLERIWFHPAPAALVRAHEPHDRGTVLPGLIVPLSEQLDRGRSPRQA
jgi:hypothetical protein